jgi:hypothetical protein
MPQQCLPGTNIQMDLQGGQDYRHTLDAVFAITGGIYLSQLAEMVGVPGATLQNWVKRGFVANPVNKRYTRRQTCRIVLLALLRHSLQIEDIVILLRSINNNLADEQDDLIDDSDLYLYFCDVVFSKPPVDFLSGESLHARIAAVTRPFAASKQACRPEDLKRLNQVLEVIVLAFQAWQLRDQALTTLAELKKGVLEYV